MPRGPPCMRGAVSICGILECRTFLPSKDYFLIHLSALHGAEERGVLELNLSSTSLRGLEITSNSELVNR